jgi:hypothetical protein
MLDFINIVLTFFVLSFSRCSISLVSLYLLVFLLLKEGTRKAEEIEQIKQKELEE